MKSKAIGIVPILLGAVVMVGCSSNEPVVDTKPFVVEKAKERCYTAMKTPSQVSGHAISETGTLFYFSRECSQNFYGMHEVYEKGKVEVEVEVEASEAEEGLGYKAGSPGEADMEGKGTPANVAPQIKQVDFGSKSTDWMEDNLEFYKEIAENDPTAENYAAYQELKALYEDRIYKMEEAERKAKEAARPVICDDVTAQLGMDCVEEDIIRS